MITVQQLVRRRIISNLLYQYKALRSAVDWTVALYLVIPVIAMAMYEYIRMWLFPPEWFYVLPYPVLLLVFCLFSLTGSQRLYIEEGDALFIRQRDNWFIPMMKKGLLYSLGVQALQSFAFIGIIMPLLVNAYRLQPTSVGIMLVILTAFKCLLC
ncbi:ABC transporter-like protein [Paenibacillus larvae subsp. larvae]|uniref:ABC transporter-like protein n=1 Tax=Paenibacillus larvae subsp. larvae TaxID=147375 RepID=A0A2L1U5Y2_9BACL|nr:ABC transporter permease [Paenibacillus larvae]AVF28278.1 ABC transporter-like protein [Paenibacillus larvae subsp. larvae]AVF32781.1 ABC transporter-like protein [Paenibacillus larvae subsp. larvae]MCY7522352.1 ABC transporter permease [Paenibacillus larvae]MCY9503129.1 ABC transporter permease [Paenibacillus larvae]MCY9681605.1 ABC transporter permease [Paenibacillus larvae]